MVHNIRLLSSRGIVFLAFFVTVLIPVGASAADDPPPPAMKVLSTEEALQVDAQTIAADRGWSEAAALEHLKRQEVTGAFVAELAEKYPRTFGGAWVGDGPDGQLFVRFAGQVPRVEQDRAKQQGIAVNFEGGAKYSLASQEARAKRVHADLVDHGYLQVATAFSIQEEKILAAATRPQGDTRPDEELRARLSPESRAADVEITFAEEPIAVFTDTYGGDRIFSTREQL